jgi:hypothetical protein
MPNKDGSFVSAGAQETRRGGQGRVSKRVAAMVQRQRFEDLRDAMAPLRLSVAPSPFLGPFKGRELRRWRGDCLMLNFTSVASRPSGNAAGHRRRGDPVIGPS